MKKPTCLLLSGLIVATTGHAQSSSDIVADEVVVTASRFEEKPFEQPIGVQVITAAEIRDSGVRTLPELLSQQAGIYTRDNSGNPNRQIDMRGFGTFSDQNTLILVDGQRISENEQVPADLASIPLSSIERIEILRGSGAVPYGGGASGGTINIITSGARPNARVGEIKASLGTYNTSDIAAGVRLGGEKVGISVNANQYDSDNYRNNNAIRQRNIQTDFRYFGENGPLYLKLGAADQDLRFPGSRTEAQLASDPRGTGTPNDYGTLSSSRVNLGTNQALGFGEFAVDLTYRERDSFAANQPGTSDINGRVTSFSPRLKIPFSFAGNHVFVAGLDWDRWDYSSAVLFPGFNSASSSDQENSAVFVKDTLELRPTSHLSLGGRLQKTDTTIIDLSGGTPTVTQVRRPRAWEVALRQEVTAAASVYGKAGQSFRVANVDDNRGTTTPLEPQTSHDTELGGEYRGGSARLRAALYRMRLKNEILFLPGDVLPPFGANVNLPPTEREGVEIEGTLAVSGYFSLGGNYTYSVAKFLEGEFGGTSVAGKTVPLVPRHRAAVTLTWRVTEILAVNGVVSYVGDQYFDNDQSNTFGRKIPGYTVTDLTATMNFGPWRLLGTVRNLFNEEYFSYGIANLASGAFNAYPAAERSILASAEYRFGR